MRCTYASYTPSGQWRRCNLEEGHESEGGALHDMSLPTDVADATEPELAERERQRRSAPPAPESDAEFEALVEASTHDAGIEHGLLVRLGIRHGPANLQRYEMGDME